MSVDPAITPVLVVGMNRSGTKWLSNLLCNHSMLAGVQSERHTGIVETNMFSIMDEKFDFSSPQDRHVMIDLWTRTDFFRRTSVQRHVLLEAPEPKTSLEIFVRFMEAHAGLLGRDCWLQKLSPEAALAIIDRLPTAKVVVIKRDFLSTIRSTLQLEHIDGKTPSVFDAVYNFVAQSKLLDRLNSRHATFPVRFEDLRDNLPRTMRAVCDFLDIPFEDDVLQSRYAKNTSFKGHDQHPAVGYVEAHASRIHALRVGLGLLPLWAITGYSRLKNAVQGFRSRPFVRGSFSELEAELQAELQAEMKAALQEDGAEEKTLNST